METVYTTKEGLHKLNTTDIITAIKLVLLVDGNLKSQCSGTAKKNNVRNSKKEERNCEYEDL